MRLLLLLALLIAPGAMAQPVGPDDVRLTLELEPRPRAPYVQEMVLLTIRGQYRLPVMLETLHQPPLPGFDWMQLGEDRWFETRDRGQTVLNLERRMALFPQDPGTLSIGAFRHELTLLAPGGWRITHEAVSDPISLETSAPPEADDWWFPLRAIEVSDNWSNQPERLDPGAAALRVVMLHVRGTDPARIPPMPEMTAAGAFVFPHPEKKIVALGPDGPETRVFWRWTIRPETGGAGYVNPVLVHYFDSETDAPREIRLSAQRVAYRGAGAAVTGEGDDTARPVAGPARNPAAARWEAPGWAVVAMALLGLIGGLWSLRSSLRVPVRPRWMDLRLVGLWRSARRGDARGLWRLAHNLLGPGQVPRDLTAAVFGTAPPPDLRATARTIAARHAQPRRRRNRPRDGS